MEWVDWDQSIFRVGPTAEHPARPDSLGAACLDRHQSPSTPGLRSIDPDQSACRRRPCAHLPAVRASSSRASSEETGRGSTSAAWPKCAITSAIRSVLASLPRERAKSDLSWIELRSAIPRPPGDQALVPTRCFHNHEVGTQGRVSVAGRSTPTFITRTYRDVEPLLGNIDPDEHFLSIGHDSSVAHPCRCGRTCPGNCRALGLDLAGRKLDYGLFHQEGDGLPRHHPKHTRGLGADCLESEPGLKPCRRAVGTG